MSLRKSLVVFILIFVTFCVKGQEGSELEWKTIDGVSIPIPPKEHPRLYLRAQHIPDLKERMSDPDLVPVWNELVKMGNESKEDDGSKKDWRYYFDQKGETVRAELDALRYLVSKDSKKGRSAIDVILKEMQKSEWPLEVNDVSRAIGRMMVSGAIVYDWCYKLLSEQEKEAFISEFLRMAKMLECGYPPRDKQFVVGHPSEWMIMRDLLSTSVAIYDEHPEMYEIIGKLLYKEFKPARDWFYKGHAYHQGTSYYNVRHTNELFAQWIMNRMGAGNLFSPSQQFVPYNLFYVRRPDGQFVPNGDVNYYDSYRPLGIVALLSGSYYKDEYVNNEFLKKPRINSHNKIFEFLWRDTGLGKKEHFDLPLTRYFDAPFGWMVARTGWDENSVIAEMKINEYHFGNHQHLDAGAFQIYYKGPLAIDSGIYNGLSDGIRGYNNSHNKSYFKRTIAHNSLLVYDPDEVFRTSDYGGANRTDFARNDGGQKMLGKAWTTPDHLSEILEGYKTGEIIAHGFGPNKHVPEFSYLKGDITEAYSDKVEEAKRSFVFLNLKNDSIPAAFIVFDKLVSSNENFKKAWLLHSIEEPKVVGNEFTISRTLHGGQGQLVCNTLLPTKEAVEIEAVGGTGKEFWVFGENIETEPVTKDVRGERGAWRVEVVPNHPEKETYFLNVMQIMDNGYKGRLSVNKIEAKNVVGVQLEDQVILFNSKSKSMDEQFSFSIEEKGTYKILITDMYPGTWQIKKDNEVFMPAMKVNADDGVLYFEGTEGKYEFYR
ncbi:heparin/heparin-sulfate lyase HepB [Aestuariivivens insulae]|uniref:heparin/heparin-sulfate lyase HepB n=1 Tax=Aestuariivivens insulae TaxID=1621988 RepID=UPI001F59068A|nr:heparin/heparin-sulfate lyase HepB [Aestuariivivens insulae]